MKTWFFTLAGLLALAHTSYAQIPQTELLNAASNEAKYRKKVKFKDARGIKETGKIYYRGEKMYINDLGNGLHIVDNSNPQQPVLEEFVDIPGNVDVALKDDILYADSYADLMVINLSTQKSKRIRNVFPESFETWKKNHPDNVPTPEIKSMQSQQSQSVGGAGVATGGSMARFSIVGDYLYVLDEKYMKVFSIAEAEEPVQVDKIRLSFIVETIFSYAQQLYIGGQEGVYIYDISNPRNPQRLDIFRHSVSCDPVVVQDDIAYITMRGRSDCNVGTINRLDIVDVSDPRNTKLLHSIEIHEPKGLAVRGEFLYLCNNGLEVYQIQDNNSVQLMSQTPVNGAFDVIAFANSEHLAVVGADGVYQYNHDGLNVELLSILPANNNINHNDDQPVAIALPTPNPAPNPTPSPEQAPKKKKKFPNIFRAGEVQMPNLPTPISGGNKPSLF